MAAYAISANLRFQRGDPSSPASRSGNSGTRHREPPKSRTLEPPYDSHKVLFGGGWGYQNPFIICRIQGLGFHVANIAVATFWHRLWKLLGSCLATVKLKSLNRRCGTCQLRILWGFGGSRHRSLGVGARRIQGCKRILRHFTTKQSKDPFPNVFLGNSFPID